MRGKILLVSLVMAIMAASCLNSDLEPSEQYYTMLCMQSEFGEGYLFTSDGGQKYYTTQLPGEYEFEPGDRSLITFTVVQHMIEGSPYDYTIRVSSISNIPVKDIIELNEVNKDTLGDAGVNFNNITVSRRYLNVDFNFWAKGKEHYFNLSYDGENQPEESDQIRLVFRHKDNGDEKITVYRAITSFDLYSLPEPKMPPYTIIFEGLDAYGNEFIREIEVKSDITVNN